MDGAELSRSVGAVELEFNVSFHCIELDSFINDGKFEASGKDDSMEGTADGGEDNNTVGTNELVFEVSFNAAEITPFVDEEEPRVTASTAAPADAETISDTTMAIRFREVSQKTVGRSDSSILFHLVLIRRRSITRSLSTPAMLDDFDTSNTLANDLTCVCVSYNSKAFPSHEQFWGLPTYCDVTDSLYILRSSELL